MARSRRREQVSLLLAGFVLASALPAGAEKINRVAMSIEAAYLYQFTRFVEWPAAEAASPLTVCVVGHDPFGEALDLAVQDRRVDGRRVTVRRLPDAEGAGACSLAFLPAAEVARLPALQLAVRNRPVLLVSDIRDFARNGGMIGFFRDADRVRFEVNPAAAEGAGLRISSRLLSIARVVGAAGVAPSAR
jgi:hypothetical protein